MSIASRRLGSAVALAAVLLATPAHAAGHRTVPGRSHASVGTIDRALAAMWHELTSLFAATGSGIDPFGTPVPSTAATVPPERPASDTGSGIDPFGGH